MSQIGIDVSNNQGSINWHQVTNDKANYSFAFLKATEGKTFTDRFYAQNRRQANANGITIGAYHYAHTTNDPEDEADFFLRVAHPKPGDLRPALDIEDRDGQTGPHVRSWILAWCNHVAVKAGVKPFIYTYPAFATECGFAGSPALAKYPLWIANYRVSQPTIPAPWKKAVVWQKSSTGKVAGVAGNCDINVWLQECDPLACWRLKLA